ncbi:MAG: hypothetical protein QM731_24950 [Chitinophagaceae bacterium]
MIMNNKKTWLFTAVLLVAATGVSLAIAGNRLHWFNGTTPVAGPDKEVAEDGREEYKKLYTRYTTDKDSLAMEGIITLYDGEDAKAAREEQPFRFCRKDGKMYTQLGYVHTFYNGELLVQLDTVSRRIIISKTDKKTVKKATQQQSLDFMFADTSNFKLSSLVSGNGVERTLTFTSDFNPEVKECRITYTPGTYTMKKADIQWWKEGAIRDTSAVTSVWITHIEYKSWLVRNIDIDAMIAAIVSVKKKEVVLQPAYSDYQLYKTF